MAEIKWVRAPAELFRSDRMLSWYGDCRTPSGFNAISRAILAATGLSYYWSRDPTDLKVGLGTLGLLALWGLVSNEEHLDEPPAAAAPAATPEIAAPPEIRASMIAAEGAVATPDVLPPSSKIDPRPRGDASPNPEGVVKLRRDSTTEVPASAGVATVGARTSNLSMKPGEVFPGQQRAVERIGARGEVRHRSVVVPSRAEIHAAYRPVPAQWTSPAELDYMNGFVGPYKRIGNLV